jgi:uroporphyrinogen-III synthase
MADGELSGFTVGVTADRRGDDQAVLFSRLGAEVVIGPTIETISVPDPAALRAGTEAIIAEPPDYLIANTGIGIRTWFGRAVDWDLADALKDALSHTRVAVRGPKAAGALTSAGVDIWWRSPIEQLGDTVERVIAEGVDGRRVALQLHGDDGAEFIARLERAGADVTAIPVYLWVPPRQPDAALALIDLCCRGEVDAITFTAGPQVRSMFELAPPDRRHDLREALNTMVVGCIGPVCAATATEYGIAAPVVPDNWRLGSLVKAVSESLRARSR